MWRRFAHGLRATWHGADLELRRPPRSAQTVAPCEDRCSPGGARKRDHRRGRNCRRCQERARPCLLRTLWLQGLRFAAAPTFSYQSKPSRRSRCSGRLSLEAHIPLDRKRPQRRPLRQCEMLQRVRQGLQRKLGPGDRVSGFAGAGECRIREFDRPRRMFVTVRDGKLRHLT